MHEEEERAYHKDLNPAVVGTDTVAQLSQKLADLQQRITENTKERKERTMRREYT